MYNNKNITNNDKNIKNVHNLSINDEWAFSWAQFYTLIVVSPIISNDLSVQKPYEHLIKWATFFRAKTFII